MSLVEVPDRADVVVVGGGIMGTSTAYFLADGSDMDVLLLERDRIAGGSTGDSSAILRHHYGNDGVADERIYSRMARWSHRFYREFEERLGADLAYDRNPMVLFADEGTREPTLAGERAMRDLDIPVTRYEGEELGARYPMVETDPYDLAVSDDEAGYADGTDAAGGFARAAGERGATVATGVAVEDVRTRDGAVTGVETGAGTVECEAVVVTAGPWTPRLMERLGVEIPIEPTREQVLLLDPPAGFAGVEDLPTTGTEEGWYVRPDFGGGILLATHHTGDPVDPDHYSDTPDQEAIIDLLEGIEGFVPDLAGAEIKGQYCGVYATTPDHEFVIDQAGPDGCYVGCGFSGHGFKHGPAVGRILADLVVDEDTEFVDVDYFSLDRFDEHPEGYAGANASAAADGGERGG